MNSTLIIAALAIVAAISVSAAALVLVLVRRQRTSLVQRDLELAGLKEEMRALCAGAVGLDQRMAAVEQRGRQLKERQEQIELREQGDRPYPQAIRMVQNGASVDELVSVCGLSRNEADLIVMMHRVDAAS
jgi:type II secretory pathway component PulJ